MTTNKQIILLLAVFLCGNLAFAQPSERRISKEQYIEMWKDEAIQQMVTYKIPASITLAQGILESGSGNSELAKYGKNHFGIKCHNWEGEGIYKDDDKKNECFRKYSDASSSFEDHSLFLTNRSRYASLFELKTTDYKSWAKGLKNAGYATNPKYADLLINLIEENSLHEFDRMIFLAENKKPNSPILSPPNVAISKPKANVHRIENHNNDIKFIHVQNGDTFYKIAKEFEMSLWQLYKYNDLNEQSFIKVGDVLFLQPKKAKGSKKTHIVKEHETLASISQLNGIKLKSLCNKNDLSTDAALVVGQKLTLR